jgi:hypothetical protein
MARLSRRTRALTVLTSLAVLASAAPALANHAWANWHWERAANPFTVRVRDSTTQTKNVLGGQLWPAALRQAANDWSASSVLNMAVLKRTTLDLAVRQICPFQPTAVRVCNVFSPDVTWLGLATVAPDVNSGDGHILAATAQMNDTWFSTPLYNSTNAQHVMCQEVGHTIGLDHQSESGADLNTCMDYATALDNPHPNGHDYQQLQIIYSHLDGSAGASTSSRKGVSKAAASIDGMATGGWSPTDLGFAPGFHGTGHHGHPHSDVFVSVENGHRIIRYVLWAY